MHQISALLYIIFVSLRTACLSPVGINRKCTDPDVVVLHVTKSQENVSVSCQVKILSDRPELKPPPYAYLKASATWKTGEYDYFAIDKDGTLLHIRNYNQPDKKIRLANGSSLIYSFFPKSQLTVRHRLITSPIRELYLDFTFDYTTKMDNSRFSCNAECELGKSKSITKDDFVEYPRNKCDLNRYRFEFPCKYKDYTNLAEAGTCVKIVNNEVPWREAMGRCVDIYGGNLVKITSKMMNEAIRSLIENESHFYWIGLSNTKLRYQYANMDNFGWLNETQPAKYMQNFVWSMLALEGHERCVVIKPSGYWMERTCFPLGYRYICQKISASHPGSPSLDLRFPHGHMYAYIGYHLDAQCSTLIEFGSTVEFWIGNSTFYSVIDGQAVHEEFQFYIAEEKFVEVGDRCFPSTKVNMNVKVTSKLLGTYFKCCWNSSTQTSYCSEGVKAPVRYVPQRPVLVVKGSNYVSIGDQVTATCSACVGTGGQLVWVLDMKNDKLQWSSQFDTETIPDSPPSPDGPGSKNTSYFRDQNITSIDWFVGHDDVCGPYVNSTFERLVGNGMHDALLVCYTSNPDKISVSVEELTVTSPTFKVFGYVYPSWYDKTILELVFVLLGLLQIPLVVFLCYGVNCVKKKEVAKANKRSTMKQSKGAFHSKTTLEAQRRRNLLRTRSSELVEGRSNMSLNSPKQNSPSGKKSPNTQRPPKRPGLKKSLNALEFSFRPGSNDNKDTTVLPQKKLWDAAKMVRAHTTSAQSSKSEQDNRESH